MTTPHSELTILIPIYVATPDLYPIITRCLDSIKKHYPDIKTVLLDDASPFPPLDWDIAITHYKNAGYVKSVNSLLAFWGSTAKDRDIAIVMNDDMVLHAGCLDRFKDIAGRVIASPADTASSPDDTFGSIFGITKEAYGVLGGLDEKYHHFFADKEYYLKAKKCEVKIIKWHDIVIDHIESATYKALGNKDELLEKDNLTFNNKA